MLSGEAREDASGGSLPSSGGNDAVAELLGHRLRQAVFGYQFELEQRGGAVRPVGPGEPTTGDDAFERLSLDLHAAHRRINRRCPLIRQSAGAQANNDDAMLMNSSIVDDNFLCVPLSLTYYRQRPTSSSLPLLFAFL